MKQRACWLGLEHLPRDLRRLLFHRDHFILGVVRAVHDRPPYQFTLGGADLSAYCAERGYYDLFQWGLSNGYTKWSRKVLFYANLGRKYGVDTSDFIEGKLVPMK